MKKVIVILMVIASMAMANVRSGSSHRADASTFDSMLDALGVYSETGIIYKNNGQHYVAWFDGDYFSLDNDSYKVMSVFAAAAIVSESTSWTSTSAVCVFEDKILAMTTACCRRLVQMSNSGYSDAQVGYYFNNNTVIANIGATNWNRP